MNAETAHQILQRGAHHMYTTLFDVKRLRISRDRFGLALNSGNVDAGVHYLPLHLARHYQR